MTFIKRIKEHEGWSVEKFHKATLFESPRMMLGLNCLEPGQVQAQHAHADQDKFYFVIEGSGWFTLGEERREVGVGSVLWAPAGVQHGVTNRGAARLVLLVGIAPAPGASRAR